MKKIYCKNCAYYHQKSPKVEDQDSDWCMHASNLDLNIEPALFKDKIIVYPKKTIAELNKNNDCNNYDFSILKYLLG